MLLTSLEGVTGSLVGDKLLGCRGDLEGERTAIAANTVAVATRREYRQRGIFDPSPPWYGLLNTFGDRYTESTAALLVPIVYREREEQTQMGMNPG